MQSKNPILDDLARVAEYAADATIAAGKEAKNAVRGGVEDLVSRLDLASTEDVQILTAMIGEAKEAAAELEKRVAALESAQPKRKPRSTSRPSTRSTGDAEKK